MNRHTMRLIRQLNRLSQRDLAKRLGVSAGYIAQMEQGLKPISRRMTNRLKTEFNISEEYLASIDGLLKAKQRATG